MDSKEKITLNEKDYFIDALTDSGKSIVESIKFVEAEINRHKNQIAVLNTAKATYINSLQSEVEKKN